MLRLLGAVDQARDLLGQRPLPRPEERLLRRLHLELRDLLPVEEGEDLEQLDDLLVLDVEPELVEGVRRHHLRVEPQGTGLGLAVLRAVGALDQRGREGMHVTAVGAPDQLDAPGEVAPLVAAAELQRDPVVAVEVEEVHGLQQHVAELGVADPGLEPGPDDVAGEHPVDREVLADVAQEVDDRHRRGPVVVVDHRRGVRSLERQERLDLAAHLLDPLLDGVERVERALARLLGVADHAGRPTHQEVRRVAGLLQSARGQDLDQVAHVQAGRGRVEADVEPHAPLPERLAQGVEVRRVGDQAAPLEVVEEGGVDGHAWAFLGRGTSETSLPHPGCGRPPGLPGWDSVAIVGFRARGKGST